MPKIELGDEVKHIYTGFTGVAVSRTNYLSGCDRIAIQPKADTKKGELKDSINFDEPEIILIKKGKKPKIEKPKKTGGFKEEARNYLR